MNEVNQSRFKKGVLKALYASYGSQDLYNSGHFNPMIRNLTTGSVSACSHHCNQCNKRITKTCYDRLHYAYCSTWVTQTYGEKHVRERCGERFARRSDGCGKHPQVQGFNRPLVRLADGDEVEVSEFDDDMVEHEQEAETKGAWNSNDAPELDALAERIYSEGNYLPGNAFDSYKRYRARHREQMLENSMGATTEIVAKPGRGQQDVVAHGRIKSLTKQKRNTDEDTKVQHDVVELTDTELVANWWAMYQQRRPK